MKKKIITILAVVAIVVALAVSLVSCTVTRTMEDYKAKGSFVLGFDSSLPPMGFIENGEYVGFDIDLAKEVAKKLGLEVKFQPIDWDNKENEIKSGRIDVIWNGFTVNEERERQFLFSHNYMINKQIVIVKSNSPYYDMQDLLDNAALRVACQSGSTAEKAIEKSDLKNKSITNISNNDIAVTQELAANRVDCVVMDSVMANYKFGNNSDYRILNNIELATENYAVGFRKSETEFRDAVNKALVELNNEGVVATIYKKYLADIEYFAENMDNLIVLPKA